jgi:2-keto-4-pentenoate hydratase/2-oxohepta-3-ene-1,7-dioic acid hydratase in catechol pathway
MKLLRTADEHGNIRPGVLVAGKRLDVSALDEDFGEKFFASGGLSRLQQFVSQYAVILPEIPPEYRLIAPVCRPSKIVCIGLNYIDHAQETRMAIPKEPVIFLKSSSAFSGPFDDILLPPDSVKSDWEAELAVVISKKASYVSEEEAMDHVAGFTVHNDVSEREYQLERGGTWDKGKGCDTFAPMGPCLVTSDEIPHPDQLGIWLSVNEEMKQKSNTSNLIFSIPFLISYVSQFMSLLPGDIISTGTPGGVGMGLTPAVFLKEGDVVRLGIERIGVITQSVRRSLPLTRKSQNSVNT